VKSKGEGSVSPLPPGCWRYRNPMEVPVEALPPISRTPVREISGMIVPGLNPSGKMKISNRSTKKCNFPLLQMYAIPKLFFSFMNYLIV